MKNFLLFLILIIPVSAFAQKTKKITDKHSDDSKEIYYVLKDSAQIKHGSYERYNSGEVLVEKGFYKMGKRDSLWYEYSWTYVSASGYYQNDKKNGTWKEYKGNYLYSSGEYTNGEKTGNWDIYNTAGKKEQVYNFSTKEITGYDSSAYTIKQRTQKILIGKDSVEVLLDRPAVYIGGEMKFFSALNKNVRYPQMEKEKNIQGTVYISFDIDATGKATNFRIAKGVSPGLDKEALRAISMITDNWSPALYKGKAVGSTITQPVKFVLM